MKRIAILLLIIVSSYTVRAQQYFGWTVGFSGKIIKTTNEGTNWINQPSGASTDLFSVNFINTSTGWTV